MERTNEYPAAPHDDSAPHSDDVRRRVESYGISHVGHVRPANEDHFAIASLQRSVQLRQTNLEAREVFDRLCGPMAYLFAVADGVGGSAGGRMASGVAVETIVSYLSETVGSYHAVPVGQEHAFLDPLRVAVQRAHDRLLETFRARGEGGGGPATTLTIALVVWPRVFVVHVGDSRAYLLHGNELRRLTRDQTMGAYLVEQRALSEQQAERSGLNDVLSSAIGATDMTPAVGVVDLEPGDTLLLCTDGLTNEVAEPTIIETLHASADAEQTCRRLLDLALEGGGRDNVTAIVVRALDVV
jgi:serine/threonine protein phosphatase PrpC